MAFKKVIRNILAKPILLVGAIAIMFLLWIWWPYGLVQIFDGNLQLIKLAGELLPDDFGPRFESFLRFISAEKAFVIAEFILLIKVMVWGSRKGIRKFTSPKTA